VATGPFRQAAVLDVVLQQSLPFQKAANAPGKGVCKPGEFLAGQCLLPANACGFVGAIDIYAIQKQQGR
jgi:hypothetical protein